MKRFIKIILLAIGAASMLQLTGCAQLTMGHPKSSIENAAKLRSSELKPVNIGKFTADTTKDTGIDKGVSIRTNGLSSPIEGSFAQYLRETLKVELQSAGLFNPQSNTEVTGILTRSLLEAPIGEGKAMIAARFLVRQNGAIRYDQEKQVDSKWDSEFIGAVAIPQAVGQYEMLYRKLIGQLLDDPLFRQAISQN